MTDRRTSKEINVYDQMTEYLNNETEEAAIQLLRKMEIEKSNDLLLCNLAYYRWGNRSLELNSFIDFTRRFVESMSDNTKRAEKQVYWLDNASGELKNSIDNLIKANIVKWVIDELIEEIKL